MRDLTILGARLAIGGYVAAHGAQKLFGAFGGHGLDVTGKGFENLGLRPGRRMAALAGAAEVVGGALTMIGLGGLTGPATIASTMAVASTAAHRGRGPFAAQGGPELAVVTLAAASALGTQGHGRYSLDAVLGLRLPRAVDSLIVGGGATLAAVLSTQARRTAGPPAPAAA